MDSTTNKTECEIMLERKVFGICDSRNLYYFLSRHNKNPSCNNDRF